MESPIHPIRELHAAGLRNRDIAQQIEEGELARVIRGWFVSLGALGARSDHPGEPPGAGARGAAGSSPEGSFLTQSAIMALRARGRIGCLNGCSYHGLWTPPGAGLHIVYGAGAKPHRDKISSTMRVHWARRPIPRMPVWPLTDCIEDAVRFHDVESALIVVESAINLERMSFDEAYAMLGRLGARGQRVARWLNVSESGSETRVRHFVEMRHVRVRPQVAIEQVGRVDLLIGESLVVECDSAAHHAEIERYRADRERDLALHALGYRVIRLSYEQIWNQWEETQEFLRRELATRRYRRKPCPI